MLRLIPLFASDLWKSLWWMAEVPVLTLLPVRGGDAITETGLRPAKIQDAPRPTSRQLAEAVGQNRCHRNGTRISPLGCQLTAAGLQAARLHEPSPLVPDPEGETPLATARPHWFECWEVSQCRHNASCRATQQTAHYRGIHKVT